jgi:hypothetical protein
MAAQEKILWVVNYDDIDDFVGQATAIGATAVAIRTDNDVGAAIAPFHQNNIKVYGWRWPSAQHDRAMQEADRAVALFAAGLDGYIADPEGQPGASFDWDQPGLADLADAFCSRITAAAPGKLFGTTSHFRAALVFPNLPWTTFFNHSTVLLPQAYWRSSLGQIGHGPAANYGTAIDCWTAAGGERDKIVPMAGELAQVTGQEIAQHAAAAAAAGIGILHFYTYADSVDQTVWDAIAQT